MSKNILKIYNVKNLVNNDIPYATEHSEETIKLDRQPTLEEMREWVDGRIELIRVIHEGRECHAIINEDGKSNGLPFNLNATVRYHAWLTKQEYLLDDVIVGNCVVLTNFDLE
jgi:hypothetical protein|tara:strand:+ start:6039 stop:6377 length:339 start_codon:yes stop_codon:yes gene_type:complete